MLSGRLLPATDPTCFSLHDFRPAAGITLSPNQVKRGTELAAERGLSNAKFQVGCAQGCCMLFVGCDCTVPCSGGCGWALLCCCCAVCELLRLHCCCTAADAVVQMHGRRWPGRCLAADWLLNPFQLVLPHAALHVIDAP